LDNVVRSRRVPNPRKNKPLKTGAERLEQIFRGWNSFSHGSNAASIPSSHHAKHLADNKRLGYGESARCMTFKVNKGRGKRGIAAAAIAK
jgi:hypothetical protein